MQVLPGRDVLKYLQSFLWDKKQGVSCSLSLSRSAVGWGLGCTGRQGERSIYIHKYLYLFILISIYIMSLPFLTGVRAAMRGEPHHFAFFKLSQLCPKASSLRQ